MLGLSTDFEVYRFPRYSPSGQTTNIPSKLAWENLLAWEKTKNK